MIKMRTSVIADIPALRELWQLAFGDSGPYVDNFFNTYYRPERMLVLEEGGLVRAMTAWFDTAFAVPGRGEYRAAYLYAVATHPDCRSRGLSGQLLAWADEWFRAEGIPAVTTVPAQPSLHNFFRGNGFRECFTLTEKELTAEELPAAEKPRFIPAAPEEYGQIREALLADRPHILYPEDALAYQAGCCALSGGGLYRADTEAGPVCLCAEGAGNGLMVVKEFLGGSTAKRLTLPDLTRIAPAERWQIREPVMGEVGVSVGWQFAMLKWLDENAEKNWDWASAAYLGLGFD